MQYTPAHILNPPVPEVTPAMAATAAAQQPVLVRRLKLTNIVPHQGSIFFYSESLPMPLSISESKTLVFGGEEITALEYCYRVLEIGDMIDAVLAAPTTDQIPIQTFWIHVVYVGQPSQAGIYSKKEDGLFAMRTKAGEKAERLVARRLRDNCGHSFPNELCETPGFFEIRYEGKRNRKPDRRCLSCGLTFEVKKRNKDRLFRVSHSNERQFAAENAASGWHAFVFPDCSIHFITNQMLAQAISTGRFSAGKDRYDTWAEINPDAIVVSSPPVCPSVKQPNLV